MHDMLHSGGGVKKVQPKMLEIYFVAPAISVENFARIMAVDTIFPFAFGNLKKY
jgi:hypothetical protein